ncbi:hypothetical protein NEOLI_000547 [Neolecta irregularis DAH-3]|uniref:BRCT domain-containing protein n=1 Tax=Neolecta irregularis (strain DAH-3) TaxID=1198029 RepID=A0A1U7LT26_NEOID|nr:hypothetical protein NEOLI_000547 [Neolecta irregularis DAH-3]|eukprot:OLL25825.1 hypothetical protein NEOLI_000547 [Neolecta irregularis DAH-3]
MILTRAIMNLSKDVLASPKARGTALIPSATKRRQRGTLSGDSPPNPSLSSGIFSGLTLYFFPSSSISSTRQKRMKLAEQDGAKLAQKLTDDVTHVIVDKNLTGSMIRKMSLLSEVRPFGKTKLMESYQ